MYRKFFSVRDLLFVLGLLFALSVFYFFTTRRTEEGERYAEISVDGQVSATVALDENGLYTPAGRPAVRIAVRNGAIGFIRSDCPDKICIHFGFLSTPGQSAVCLPNKVVVRVAAGARKTEERKTLDSATY
ncbi:MAG: NusG domain II-containing protein [Synergistaceae bacterium]|jgi:hypothetical protein|nr:NusG domain II-containing protein [Synergistaceae bacterium]